MFNELLDCGLMSLASKLTNFLFWHYVIYFGSNLAGIIIAGYALNNYGASGRIYALGCTMLISALLCVMIGLCSWEVKSAIYTLGILLGSSGGVYNQVFSIIFADFFGNVDSAFLYGVALACTTVMTGTGPLLFDYIAHIVLDRGRVRFARHVFLLLSFISVVLGIALVLVFQVLWKRVQRRHSLQKISDSRDISSVYTPLLTPTSPALIPKIVYSSFSSSVPL
jgi:MFS family permease